tara:strand:+ start:230 stop:691 length:462 start_codon:yes stop_codon:yes gene_type:complete
MAALVFTGDAHAAGLAQAITDDTAIYAITYTFTTEDYELAVPVITERNLLTPSEPAKTGYTFTTSEGGDAHAGSATGLVLSNTQIKDGKYYVPKNTTASFTLFVVLSLAENDPRAKYGLQMTTMPFTIIAKDSMTAQNISTLGAYKTKEVGLN